MLVSDLDWTMVRLRHLECVHKRCTFPFLTTAIVADRRSLLLCLPLHHPFFSLTSSPPLLHSSPLFLQVDHNDKEHLKLNQFNDLWKSQFQSDSFLVFSTGRSPHLFHQLASHTPLLQPDILVCSVGTEILIHNQPNKEWERYLDQGWSRDKVASIAAQFPDLVLQEPSEQRPHKVSFKLTASNPNQVLDSLRSELSSAGLDTTVIYSGGVDVDILPSRASKGKALSFLIEQIGIDGSIVMVCGDSGNDIELFAVPHVYGCCVQNAHAELRDWVEVNGNKERVLCASVDGPGGIVQALKHFKFVDG